MQALVGTSDLRADFNGDGLVTSADAAILQTHLGATCPEATPALPSTWGRLKAAYR